MSGADFFGFAGLLNALALYDDDTNPHSGDAETVAANLAYAARTLLEDLEPLTPAAMDALIGPVIEKIREVVAVPNRVVVAGPGDRAIDLGNGLRFAIEYHGHDEPGSPPPASGRFAGM